jgi:hypothetical protein
VKLLVQPMIERLLALARSSAQSQLVFSRH